MSAGQTYRGMSDLARLTHHAERGTPAGSLKLFLWDAAAVLGALLLVSATGVGIAFAAFILLFCAV